MIARQYLRWMIFGAGLIVSTRPAFGQPSDGEQGTLNYFQRFVLDGGFITWGILIPLSIITLALILDHIWRIRPAKLMGQNLYEDITLALDRGDLATAWRLANEEDTFWTTVVRRGLSELSNGTQAAEHAVVETTQDQANRLLSRIEYLNIIGSVSPMIGLFGTVYGIIHAFNTLTDVVRQGGVTRPDQLAEGISVALVTTFWGLMIAIPALAVYGVLRNRIDSTASHVASHLLERLRNFKNQNVNAPDATSTDQETLL